MKMSWTDPSWIFYWGLDSYLQYAPKNTPFHDTLWCKSLDKKMRLVAETLSQLQNYRLDQLRIVNETEDAIEEITNMQKNDCKKLSREQKLEYLSSKGFQDILKELTDWKDEVTKLTTDIELIEKLIRWEQDDLDELRRMRNTCHFSSVTYLMKTNNERKMDPVVMPFYSQARSF